MSQSESIDVWTNIHAVSLSIGVQRPASRSSRRLGSLRRFLVTCFILFVGLVSAACLPAVKATVDVSDIESAFPVIEHLGVRVYNYDDRNSHVCQYFYYDRGAYGADPSDRFCLPINVDDIATGAHPDVQAFDDQARLDLATLASAFEPNDLSLEGLNLSIDNSAIRFGRFGFDRCVTYVFDPGWTVLPADHPGDSTSTAIDRDWYKVDSCPS